MATYLYLYEVLPGIHVDYENYGKCEREVLTPQLEGKGFTLQGSWYSGERDDFGPLSRCIDTDKGTVWYG